MDYFISRVGRGLRWTVSIIAALCAGVIIISSAIGGGILVPICGGVCLIPAGMIIFENVKIIRDLEKAITRFRNDLKDFEVKLDLMCETTENLKEINVDLEQVKEELKVENQNLGELLNSANQKLDTLTSLVNQHKSVVEELKENLKQAEENNQVLSENADKLINIKHEYEIQILHLTSEIENIQVQLTTISNIKDDYEQQLKDLKTNNNVLEENIEKLNKELERINDLYSQAKTAISTLIKTKDIFEDIHKDMAETATQTGKSVEELSMLIKEFDEKRKEELFRALDKNHDGTLSLDEFLNDLDE